MKRRDLLKAGSGAFALAGMLSAPARAATEAPFAWSLPVAIGLVGQTFWLNHPDRRALALVLQTVRAPTVKQARIDQFTLEFEGKDAGLTANTYEFEHPAAGRFHLYIEPMAAGPRNKRYRAEFNLIA